MIIHLEKIKNVDDLLTKNYEYAYFNSQKEKKLSNKVLKRYGVIIWMLPMNN